MRIKLYHLLLFSLLLFVGLSGLVVADETKWIAVGMLHDWYSSAGCEQEVGRRHLISDQQDGLRWPAQFRYQDCKAAKGLWIGTTNYYDPLVDRTFDYKVVHAGPRHLDEENETMPVEFKLIGRFNHPVVLVDGTPASNMNYMDAVDEIDETLKADRLLYNVVNTSIGITMTRKIYAFTNQYHNNYFIYDYVFKNTGIIDKKGTVYPQTLTGVVFFFQYRYAPCRETGPYGYYWMPQNSCWGRNTMNDVIGQREPVGVPFRALFSWMGKHSKWKGPGDCIGEPNIGSPSIAADGHLGAPQYVGVVTIHADKSADNKTDDPYQPTTTWYLDSDAPITQAGNDQFNATRMAKEYAQMVAGHPPLTHAEAVGDGNADEFGKTAGGYSQTQGFGPYTLAPGDSIHIVLAEGIAGLSREACYKIGAQWWDWANGGSGPYELPDGSTTNDGNEFKNAWVYTGKDSLFQTFERAIANYQSNFDVPQPPPPPDLFEVNSGGDRISLSWSDNAESWPNFAGYRIYRAVDQPDTFYTLIFECGEGTDHPNIVHKYDDTSPQRGFDYYYYIVSFDNGSTNDISPGTPLESSMFYTMTNEPAYLRRQAGRSLDAIRVVPNPYNIRASSIQYGASGPDRIMFLNIPAFCTIKIYTERGDLIKTIEHTNGSGDATWESITSSRQVVVSGIYIAHFEVTQDYKDPVTGELLYKKGDQAVRKFLIIR